MSKSREQVQKWLKKIDITGKSVLDVGSGAKEKYACNYTIGIPTIYDTLDSNEAFEPTYCVDFNNEMDFTDQPYDIVFCLETLEHLWNPVQAVNNLSKLTKEVCYISTPLINPIHDTHDFLRYTIQWFEEVLPKAGFRTVIINPRSATAGQESLQEFFNCEGMRMSKVTLQRGYGRNLFDIGYVVEASK